MARNLKFPIYAPNGLNLSKSIHNPNSRINRIMKYLHMRGEATKREILRDVFNKKVGSVWQQNEVSIGWGSYVFNLGVKYHLLKKVRRNNTVYWSLR